MTETQNKRSDKSGKKRTKPVSYNYEYSGNRKRYEDGRGRTAHRTIVRLVKLADVVMVSIPFYAAWIIYYSHKVFIRDFYRRGNWMVMGLFTVLYFLLSHLYSGYSIHISRVSEIVYAQSLGALIADGIMFIIMWLLIRHVPGILVLLIVFAAVVIWILPFSILFMPVVSTWLMTAILEKVFEKYGS